MYTDRDSKLVGGIVLDYLETNKDTTSTEAISHVNGTLANIQHQNGFVEIRWINILNVTRNLLALNLLPLLFWYFTL